MMTERQRADTLLEDLLASNDADMHQSASRPARTYATATPSAALTDRQAMQLLREAHEIGTPTLAPDGRTSATFEPHHAATTDASFGNEFKALVQRYPLQTVLAATGIAYVLTRRKH